MRCSLFALPIFGVCLVIQPSNSGKIICGKNQYTIVNSTGTVQSCLSCETCHRGRGLHPECGSTLLGRPTMIECRPCKPGTFSSEYDSSPCKGCHQCAEHEIKKADCTNKSDTVCSGKCEQGYFMSEIVHNCQECSVCCSDGKDEKVQECARLGIDKDCTPRPDKNCGSSNPGATESKKSLPTIIGVSVAGSVVAVGALILMAYYWWRKRKRLSGQQPEAPSGKQRNGSANTPSNAYAREGPRPESRGVTFDSNCYNSSYHGTPQTSRQVIEGEEPKPVPVQDGIALVAVLEEKQKPTNKKKSSLASRQDSQDSQTSNDEFRKRSFSSRSIGEFVEKISLKRDNSLLESDEDSEAHEPIKISKHPKSQTAKEGSKVELACKLEKKSKNFMYQWFKDGVALIGKNESVLVLNPIQLQDFGCYMCLVSYKDSFGEAEKSKHAKLDVIHHPGYNGMRLKRLAELDVGIMDRLALLLETRKHGCGDWRTIGSNYDMEGPGIAALDNAALNAGDRGKAVLEFVKATRPNLTVYDFCKTLKEDNFKRLDIVEQLEKHFLVSIKSDGQ